MTEKEPEGRTRRPTIIDVATHARVSKSLASRALRGDAGVSDRNRDEILKSANTLGYRLNSAARSLVKGVSGLIGVVLNEIGNQHHTEIVAGIEEYAHTINTRVIIGNGRHSAQELGKQIDTMLELRVDGLIVVSSWVPYEVLERAGAEVPTVVITHLDRTPPEVDTIASDDVTGASLAIEHFLTSGRTRLAYVTRSTSATSRARILGVTRAAAKANQAVTIHELAPDDTVSLQQIITSRTYDAILCNNDLTAAEVIRLSHEQHIEIPYDLALIGYDNTALATLVAPTLTSVDQPQFLMGEQAAKTIHTRIQKNQSAPLRKLYAPRLILRESAPATNQT